LVTYDVKQSTDRHQNLNESRNHNKAKERTGGGTIQQVESEAQNQGNEGTNNGKEDLEEGIKSIGSMDRTNLISTCSFENHQTQTHVL
jgi:hypothetical protein